MRNSSFKMVLLATAACCLAACGGGGGGAGIATTPPPPTAPPPPPPPFGVTSSQQFATVGSQVEFRWNAAAKAYEVKLPGYEFGKLRPWTSNPVINDVIAADGTKLPFNVSIASWPDYQYTNYAVVTADGSVDRLFAYGLPTAPGDVPTIGSAAYTADIIGGDGGYSVSGKARLSFDFAGGTLSGYMRPILSDAWFEYDLGQYDFTQTIYSAGSTTFSGKFTVPGGSSADSSFSGRFNGPRAAELMAAWQAPFADPYDGQSRTMSGVWIGKKD